MVLKSRLPILNQTGLVPILTTGAFILKTGKKSLNCSRVLITGAGAPGAPGIIKSLYQFKVIGVDARKDAVGAVLADKFETIPLAGKKGYIKSLLGVAKKYKADVILPLTTAELVILAKNKELFIKNGIRVSISPVEGLRIANNKHLLMEHCGKNGIPVPDFRVVKNYKDFKREVYNLGYPKKNVCFKPSVSSGMRGFRVLTKKLDRLSLLIKEKPTNTLTTLEEIEPILKNARRFPELIVMEYLPGEEYSVDVLADNGKSLVVIPRLREMIKMGISFVGTTVKDKEIIEYSKKIVETLGLNGNIGFQFKRDKKGVPKIIESNPRLQGTVVLCTAAGANLVSMAVQLALGQKIKAPKIKWGTKMIRYWEEIYYKKGGYVKL